MSVDMQYRKSNQPEPQGKKPAKLMQSSQTPEPPIKSVQLWEVLGFSGLSALGGRLLYKSNDAAAVGAIIGGLVTYYWTSKLDLAVRTEMPRPLPRIDWESSVDSDDVIRVQPNVNVRKPPVREMPLPDERRYIAPRYDQPFRYGPDGKHHFDP